MWQENWREKLNEYRHTIDEIDFGILELLGKRTELSERFVRVMFKFIMHESKQIQRKLVKA